ncbi:hypothetical protein [Brasilonema bromeliae]|uniref:Uncharacterized protein n=1 Tax=Brasilonema bromeliae SPC951 TaxID=385972 RepID=A0ABX1PGT3_9CYAN|nr:hypothetical protein [Brasilonema bromeliae]NMG22685.1 hypothetical protein [Brasilonema bromeliae SPC951]
MIDVIVLTKILSPFLPYLLKLGDKAAEEAAKKLGADSWEKAKVIWVKLHPKVEAKPSAQEAVQDVAQAPEDEDALAALRQQLKKLLKEDPTLESELTRLLTEAEAPQSRGNINIAGDVKGVSAYDISGGSITQGNIS